MSHQLPSIFIGSSTEGIDVAREVELHLQGDAITTIWTDGIFGLGSGTLEALMNTLDQFDFAVMILSPDDLVESRSQIHASPRDNVLFELGLFMGRLGRSRVFIVYEKDANVKLPSDFGGITLAPYHKHDNLSAALSQTCTPIIKAVRALGFSENRAQQQISRIEAEQSKVGTDLETMKFMIASMMPTWELDILSNIASSREFMVNAATLSDTFRRDLGDLWGRGFIKQKQPGRHLPFTLEHNVKDYYEIADLGRQYLRLREQFLGKPV